MDRKIDKNLHTQIVRCSVRSLTIQEERECHSRVTIPQIIIVHVFFLIGLKREDQTVIFIKMKIPMNKYFMKQQSLWALTVFYRTYRHTDEWARRRRIKLIRRGHFASKNTLGGRLNIPTNRCYQLNVFLIMSMLA